MEPGKRFWHCTLLEENTPYSPPPELASDSKLRARSFLFGAPTVRFLARLAAFSTRTPPAPAAAASEQGVCGLERSGLKLSENVRHYIREKGEIFPWLSDPLSPKGSRTAKGREGEAEKSDLCGRLGKCEM